MGEIVNFGIICPDLAPEKKALLFWQVMYNNSNQGRNCYYIECLKWKGR